MKIPPVADREAFYDEISEECLLSRDDRIAEYERLRGYYLWGREVPENPAIFNKILPQMDLLVSFLFAAETTRFGIVLGESAKAEEDLTKVPVLSRHINNAWSDSNADVQFGQAVTWALVYNSMFVKLVQRGRQTYPYLVDPHSFGVLREDMPFLDDQDAFVHTYTISKRSLERILEAFPAKKKADIMNRVSASLRQEVHDMPAGLNRIIMSTFPMTGGPNGPGQVTSPYASVDTYRARVADERVDMRELWVWDDDLNDYRVCTQASGGVMIYDRANTDTADAAKSMYLPGEHPFIQVCPNPSYDYFWGHSEVARVTQLQEARETRMEQIMELLSRQVKPPATLRGNWAGIQDETLLAMQMFGASASSVDPTADAKLWYPTVPNDVYAEIRSIDEMFNEMTGLSNVTQGKGESGVRSKGHAAELARLGSSRIRKRAFTLEDALDKIGTHYLRLTQQHDPTKFMDTKGVKFSAGQFTDDFAVKVDGHSSSPIFIEDKRALALEMLQVHAIDRAEYIEQVDPANKQVLLSNLKKIEAGEAAAKEAEMAAEAQAKGATPLKVAK